MKRRILSIALGITMLVGLLPTTALAEGETYSVYVSGKEMTAGDGVVSYYVNGENGTAGTVSSDAPGTWNAKLSYDTEEGCLSLEGVRKTKRYENIEVEYYDFAWKKQRKKLSGWTAQICQHELDHLVGRII